MTRSTSLTVHALSAGYLTLPERFFVTPLEDENSRKTVPSLSFLVVHTDHATGKITRLVFDLGIRKKLDEYSKQIYDHACTRTPLSGDPAVVDSLALGGLNPSDIEAVIFSHLHWDHVGTPSDFGSSAYIIGPKAGKLIDGESRSGSHNHFEPGLLDRSRTVELLPTDSGDEVTDSCDRRDLQPHIHRLAKQLSKPWQSKGPFDHVLDVFGDSSLYIVTAPGHLDGHINLLCRLDSGKHVYLAGDSCHDARLLSGEKEIASWRTAAGSLCCIHSDRAQAEKTLTKIRSLLASPGALREVEIIFAHDADWEQKGMKLNKFFPGSL